MRFRLHVAVLLSWLGPCVTLTNASVFRPLPDLLGGATESLAWGVSRDGSTIVGTSTDSSGQAAVRWTMSGVEALDRDSSGVRPYVAFAVSSDGRAVTGLTGPGMRAFIWSSAPDTTGQRTRRLPELPGAAIPATRAHDLDDSGRFVVGYAHAIDSTPMSPRVQAVYWDTASSPPRVQALSTSGTSLPITSAIAVSGDGSTITGDARGPGTIVPFAMGRDAPVMTTLPITFASTTDAIGAISRNGRTIVGGLGGRAFRFNGTLGYLDSLTSNWTTFAGAVSDDAGVIVGSAQGPNIGDSIAVMWDADGRIRRIDQWLTSQHGVNLTGWSLVSATGVSGDGLIIVGYGINPLGQTQAFVIQIPSPTTGSLLLLLGTARRRRAQ